MVYLEIDAKNFKTNGRDLNGRDLVKELDHHLSSKNNKAFILFFMEGCGPCNATRPEWKKIQNVLNKDFLNRNDIIIASIDHQLAEGLKNVKSKPVGFPTMSFITNSGMVSENYEDSKIDNKDRTIDSFVEWIKLKSGEQNISKSDKQNGGTIKKRDCKKVSKYKRGKCNNKKKGFTQKRCCKYRCKKVHM